MSGASTQFPGGYMVTWRDKYPLVSVRGAAQRFDDDTEVDVKTGGLVLQFIGYGIVVLSHEDAAGIEPDETCQFDPFLIGWAGKDVKSMDVDRRLVRFLDGSWVCAASDVVEVRMQGCGMIHVFRPAPEEGHGFC